MAELAKAYVQILPTMQGIQKNLENELGGASEKAATTSGHKFSSIFKKIIASVGIGETLKKAINEGAELEQNLGGVQAVFGEFANNIEAGATRAYKNMGLSASDYMATANKMASLFQGSGIAQEKSLILTTKAMQRAADVASVMGLDTSAAMESIAGAAKGNFTIPMSLAA